jgi:hypothetical protein
VEGGTVLYKEIEFSEGQTGFGLVFTDPSTGIRSLVGIFDTHEEAYKNGQKGSKQALMIRPEVVIWDRKNYELYDWVYKK